MTAKVSIAFKCPTTLTFVVKAKKRAHFHFKDHLTIIMMSECSYCAVFHFAHML